jgi:hypothetical protein
MDPFRLRQGRPERALDFDFAPFSRREPASTFVETL